jgi:pimeloyl-ACP methyl ester carboxylesterase
MIKTKLNVRSSGDGPQVVLLHSSGSSGRQWDPLVNGVQDRFRLHAVDLHGHGGTPAWLGDHRMRLEDDAALVEPLLHAPGCVHLVGHSYGGALALKLAAMHPDRVSSVAVFEPVLFRVLFDYNPRDPSSTEVLIAAASIRHWLELGHVERSAERFVDFWSGEGSWAALPANHQQIIAARMPSVVAHFLALFGDSMTRDTLSRLHMPVLCLTGEKTRTTTRRLGELLRLAMPQATHATLTGMGHMGPVTHPVQVASRIAGFLDAQVMLAAGRDLLLEAA